MNIRKIGLLTFILVFAQSTHAGTLFSHLWNILFSKGLYTCAELYRETDAEWKKHKNILVNPVLQQNIVSNSAFYIDLLNKNILKREEFGEKYKLFDYKKILFGIGQIWLSIIFLKLGIDHKFRYMPVSILLGYTGINNTLNGSIRYQKSMEATLDRDRKLRKRLLHSVEPLRNAASVDFADNRSKIQKTLNMLNRATKLVYHKLKPANWKLLLACTTGYLLSGLIYKFSRPFTINLPLTLSLDENSKKSVHVLGETIQDVTKVAEKLAKQLI